jgi:16S rRNA processing protein RimM
MDRSARSPGRLILMGVFGAPQGVRGEVRVKSLTGEAGAIGAYGPLTDKNGARAFVFDALRPLKDDMLVARLAGVSTREAAEALRGVEIFARRDQLPNPSEDEFYYDDLVGLEAVTCAGDRLGRVASLMNYGAGDIIEIAPEPGGEALLLPFTKAVVARVDLAGGRIVIQRPDKIEGEKRPGGPPSG